VVSWGASLAGDSMSEAHLEPERRFAWLAIITAIRGKNTAQANKTQRKTPGTKIMLRKHAVRKAIV
jgi:hypothetical protein